MSNKKSIYTVHSNFHIIFVLGIILLLIIFGEIRVGASQIYLESLNLKSADWGISVPNYISLDKNILAYKDNEKNNSSFNAIYGVGKVGIVSDTGTFFEDQSKNRQFEIISTSSSNMSKFALQKKKYLHLYVKVNKQGVDEPKWYETKNAPVFSSSVGIIRMSFLSKTSGNQQLPLSSWITLGINEREINKKDIEKQNDMVLLNLLPWTAREK